ncbi:hypothetical protein AGMMS50230_11690 [Spirochaetia bacterium]|nr:hypothetical protein AGMMS50230_11690 [Spirochaetia bacterium]
MQLDFGIVPQNRQQQDLYIVAYKCAELHTYYKCNDCNNCQWNIDLMGYASTETRLIKARAAIDYANKYNTYNKIMSDDRKLCVGLIIFIIIGIIVFRHLEFGDPENTYQYPSTTAAYDAMIPYVRKTQQLLRDVNKDGKINCIDYAVVFYEVTPNSKIIHCWDYRDLNHLLNKVGDLYIEPQARDGRPGTLWPMSFPGSVKKDETQKYAVYARARQ